MGETIVLFGSNPNLADMIIMATSFNDDAVTVDIQFRQGDTWSRPFTLGANDDSVPPTFIPWDLTGWVGHSQIRKTSADSGDSLAELTVIVDPDQTTNTGKFVVTLDKTASTLLPKNCMWDIEFTQPDGTRKTYMAGSMTVTREITRE